MTEGERAFISEAREDRLSRGFLMYGFLVLGAVSLMCVIGLLAALHGSSKRHAYIVKVEPDGSTDVGLTTGPQPEASKYFIAHFCSQYFSRGPETIKYLPQTVWYFSPYLRGEVKEVVSKAQSNYNPMGPQVNVVATSVNLGTDGSTAYVSLAIIRTVAGQVTDPEHANTFIRFECQACDGRPVDDSLVSADDPLGIQIDNLPTIEGAK